MTIFLGLFKTAVTEVFLLCLLHIFILFSKNPLTELTFRMQNCRYLKIVLNYVYFLLVLIDLFYIYWELKRSNNFQNKKVLWSNYASCKKWFSCFISVMKSYLSRCVFFLDDKQINGKLFRSLPFCSQGESVGGKAYQKSKYSHPIALSSQQKARKQLEKNELICLFDLQIKEKLWITVINGWIKLSYITKIKCQPLETAEMFFEQKRNWNFPWDWIFRVCCSPSPNQIGEIRDH